MPAATLTANPVSIPQTSLADPTPAANEVTVQFRRWTAFGPTAYQRGQCAGFNPRDAELLVRRGVAVLVHDRAMVRVLTDTPAMVKK